MSNGQRVLVVDGVSEIQEVLQAILEPRGLRVDWMRSRVDSRRPAPSSSSQRPDIVVIDAEAAPLSTRNEPAWEDVPQVIIGERLRSPSAAGVAATNRRYLNKPFQYTELIQAIEVLLPRVA